MNVLSSRSNDKKIALKIAVIYGLIAALWIVFSDQILLLFSADLQQLTQLQSAKGWFYVFLTATLLFFLLEKEIRKKSLVEERLRKNGEKLAETQRIARLGSWELEIAGRELWWSAETYRLFGCHADEKMTLEKFIDLIHPEDRQRIEQNIEQAIEQEQPLAMGYRVILPDGDVRYLQEESRLIYEQNSDLLLKRVGYVQDVTSRKKMEKEREKLVAELETSLQEINTLRSILPLCSYCKKIRDDQGDWQQVDVYIHRHLEADISHSICPHCLEKYYPEFSDSPTPTPPHKKI